MKRLLPLFLILLILFPSACSFSPPPYKPELADSLLDSGAFSETLAPMDADVVWILYRLEDAGLKHDSLIEARSYRSTGATCEEVSVLLFSDDSAAQTAEKAVSGYLSGQIAANRDYRPAELAKLESAILSRRANSLVLLVAAHPDKAASLLK